MYFSPPTQPQDRFRAIETDITNPRRAEREYIDRWRNVPFDPQRAEYLCPPLDYDYPGERFSVRRKDFWPVWQINKVFAHFNDPHNIGHESDGLILQGEAGCRMCVGIVVGGERRRTEDRA
jgi:hypothetical protein